MKTEVTEKVTIPVITLAAVTHNDKITRDQNRG